VCEKNLKTKIRQNCIIITRVGTIWLQILGFTLITCDLVSCIVLSHVVAGGTNESSLLVQILARVVWSLPNNLERSTLWGSSRRLSRLPMPAPLWIWSAVSRMLP